MKAEIEVNEISKNSLQFHEEIATFDGGRIVSNIGTRTLVIESDKHNVKFEITVENIVKAIDDKVGL